MRIFSSRLKPFIFAVASDMSRTGLVMLRETKNARKTASASMTVEMSSIIIIDCFASPTKSFSGTNTAIFHRIGKGSGNSLNDAK